MRSLAALLFVLPALAFAQDAVELNKISRVEVKNGAVEITGSGTLNFNTFTMSDPPRLVIDISEAVFAGVPEVIAGQGAITGIKTASYGSASAAIARVLVGFDRDVETDLQASGNTLIVKVLGGVPSLARAEDVEAGQRADVTDAGDARTVVAQLDPVELKAQQQAAAEAQRRAEEDRVAQEKAAREAAASAEEDRRRAEEDRRRAEDERKKTEEAARAELVRAQAEAQKKAEAARQQEQEAHRKAVEEAQRRAEADRKRQEEAQRRADAQAAERAQKEVADKAKRDAEEAQRKAVEEAQRRAEADRKRQEAAQRRADAEAAKRADQDRREQQEEQKRAALEAKKTAQEERLAQIAEAKEAKKRAEEGRQQELAEQRKAAEQARRAAIEERMRLMAEQKKAASEARARVDEEKRQKAEAARLARAENLGGGEKVKPSGARRTLSLVGFRPVGGGSRITITTDGPATYEIREANERTVVVALSNTRISQRNNALFLDTSFFGTPVQRVNPKEVDGDVLVEITLKDAVPYQAKQAGGDLVLDFKGP